MVRGWAGTAVGLLFLLSFLKPLHGQDCAATIARASKAPPTYGWEVEYVRGENPGLWELYRPQMILENTWTSWSLPERDQWTRDHVAELAPTIRVPSLLVRTSIAPNFLPERLIQDESGNWEIIGGISQSVEQLESEIRQIEAVVGPGSYQAHVVLPFANFEKGAAGYSLFSADLLAFRKLTSQLARHQKDPKQIPGAFFGHPYLSVFTKMKRDMLVAVAHANSQGKGWQSALPLMRDRYPSLGHIWDENRPFYKYTLANALRTDIYGNEGDSLVRWGFEVRSAHKSLATLFEEVGTLRTLMNVGFESYDRFLTLKVLDPNIFERAFSPSVQQMLLASIPEGEVEDPRSRYFAYLYRPFEQYAVLLDIPQAEASALRRNILKARTNAVSALEALAAEFGKRTIDARMARERSLVLLAKFAEETTLLPHLENYLQGSMQVQKVSAYF